MGRMSLSPLWAEKCLSTCHGQGHVTSIGVFGDTLDSLGLALREGARDPVAHGVVLQPEDNYGNGKGNGYGTDYGFGDGNDYGFRFGNGQGYGSCLLTITIK